LNSHGGFNQDQASSYSAGWNSGGTIAVNPGTAIFVDNVFVPLSSGQNYSATFVGSVPSSSSGLFTNVLTPGLNLVGSIIPVTGDMQTSSILNFQNTVVNGGSNPSTLAGDSVLFFDSTYNSHIGGQGAFDETAQAYSYSSGWSGGAGPNGDPVIASVSTGFYFINTAAGNINWVENFTLNP
jgi:hypothetical protein